MSKDVQYMLMSNMFVISFTSVSPNLNNTALNHAYLSYLFPLTLNVNYVFQKSCLSGCHHQVMLIEHLFKLSGL